MEVYDVVRKLTGYIDPVGDTAIDEHRLNNLLQTIELFEQLYFDLKSISRYQDSHMASVRRIGERAQKCLNELHKELSDA